MQYDKYNEICSQGTQTKLSTASKDDVLVSFTSTCSLLSTTFTQVGETLFKYGTPKKE